MAALYTYAPFLQCVQNAMRQLAQEPPNGIFDVSDEHAVLMGAYGNLIGTMLAESENWQQFVTEFVVTGDSTRTGFDLPGDISRFANNTGWTHANRRPVVILNAQEDAGIRAWTSASVFVNPACRLVRDQLLFLTPPGIGERITFEYFSKHWVLDADGVTRKGALSNNADTPLFDSVLFTTALKLKWLETRGMPTGPVQSDFNRRYLQVTMRGNLAQDLSLNGGGLSGARYLDTYNVPDTGIGL